MYAVVKQYCISTGVAQLMDTISVDELHEYVCKIEAKRFPSGIETRGRKHAILCAHDLTFSQWDRFKPAAQFMALYRGREEFFSISFDGKKAVLKILDINKAHNLYDELPTKVHPVDFVFDPAAYSRSIEAINQANEDEKDSEREEAKVAAKSRMGPTERFRENPGFFSRNKM